MFAIDKFRMIERKRAAAAVKLAHANDNRRAARYVPAGSGRTALVGRWRTSTQTGRLEWNWSLEPVADEALADEPAVPLSGECRGRANDARRWRASSTMAFSPEDRASRSSRKIRIALTAQGA
jgi:hypothetical protein